MAESSETGDHASATNLLERILLKAAQDTLWVERGTSAEAYGLYWEDATSATPLLQSVHVWETVKVL
ncbi:hypothetical protein FEF09_20525 [Chitinophaga pinensis]|uniref:Uncharacterized protein n=1 Tax=Chitinophaga pinensis TaxID=79329 RepID=A0A5C6LQB2_9BACT|nr:hypothetical protein FEF09_20525 [Chitinophaga pinensis]